MINTETKQHQQKSNLSQFPQAPTAIHSNAQYSVPVPHLPHGVYYIITNMQTGLSLSMPKSNKFTKDKPQFQQMDPNNINQLWMIQQISPNRYQIVHAISTLVLQSIPGSNNCKLEFGKQKSSQLYFIQQGMDIQKQKNSKFSNNNSQGIKYEPPVQHVVDKHLMQQEALMRTKSKLRQGIKNVFNKTVFKAGQRFIGKIRIKQKQKSRKYLYCDQVVKSVPAPSSEQNKQRQKSKDKKPTQSKVHVLKYMQIDISHKPQSSLWQIRQVFPQQNQVLARTCYISSFRSGQVLDVPEASDKQGVQIIQYPCNFRFNQKWQLKKVDELNGYNYYTIKNAKNGLVLDIKGANPKQGTAIIQWQDHQKSNQIWRLQQQSKRTFLIRSALDKDLLLGVRENSVKQCAQIVTSKMDTQCFWVIHGHIPE